MCYKHGTVGYPWSTQDLLPTPCYVWAFSEGGFTHLLQALVALASADACLPPPPHAPQASDIDNEQDVANSPEAEAITTDWWVPPLLLLLPCRVHVLPLATGFLVALDLGLHAGPTTPVTWGGCNKLQPVHALPCRSALSSNSAAYQISRHVCKHGPAKMLQGVLCCAAARLPFYPPTQAVRAGAACAICNKPSPNPKLDPGPLSYATLTPTLTHRQRGRRLRKLHQLLHSKQARVQFNRFNLHMWWLLGTLLATHLAIFIVSVRVMRAGCGARVCAACPPGLAAAALHGRCYMYKQHELTTLHVCVFVGG